MDNKVADEYVKIITLNSAIESQLVGSILEERNIPHMMRSFHDTAYDGLFQVQKGWGELLAQTSHKEEIIEIVRDVRSKNFDDEA